MEIGKPAVGIVAALCIAAGTTGVYLATRGEEPAPDTAGIEVTQTEESIAPSDPVLAEPRPEAPAPRAERPAPAPRRVAAREPESRPLPAPVRSEPAVDPVTTVPRAETRPLPEPPVAPAPALEREAPRAPEPPSPEFVDLVVPAESVLGLQVETSLTSEAARVEDEVVARVTRDVRVGDRVAIPAGSRAHGEVTLVERGGKVRERARLGVRFTSVVLADGTRVPLETDTIYREGDAPSNESAATIGGGAIGGAIIGGILGGAKGAAIGGSIGAGAGTAAVLAGGRNAATLPTGTPVTVRVLTPTTVTVEK